MSRTSGPIKEMNVTIDEGDGGWVRVVMVDGEGEIESFLIEKDVAENAAMQMSHNVVHRDWIDEDE